MPDIVGDDEIAAGYEREFEEEVVVGIGRPWRSRK
jgi:hypothetical protein